MSNDKIEKYIYLNNLNVINALIQLSQFITYKLSVLYPTKRKSQAKLA
jgi:hypothetical protein